MKPEIYYKKTGNGKPLILLHGNKEDHHIFDELVEALKNDFTIYAVDSRGHGKSGKADEYHYSDMADDILDLIEKEQLDKPYFYGFSDGAIIGLLCAIKQDCFSKLMLSGANTKPSGLKPLCLLGMVFSYVFSRDKRTKMMLREPNITALELSKISCPTLVLAGEFDIIKLSDTHFIYNNIKNASLEIIKGKNHGNYIVHKTYLKEKMKSFFN